MAQDAFFFGWGNGPTIFLSLIVAPNEES